MRSRPVLSPYPFALAMVVLIAFQVLGIIGPSEAIVAAVLIAALALAVLLGSGR